MRFRIVFILWEVKRPRGEVKGREGVRESEKVEEVKGGREVRVLDLEEIVLPVRVVVDFFR